MAALALDASDYISGCALALAAKRDYPADYVAVVDDLAERFAVYARVVDDGDIARGKGRLDAVTKAVDAANVPVG